MPSDAPRNLLEAVLRRCEPTPEERERVGGTVSKVVDALNSVIRIMGVNATVEVEGSFAKDTWLSGDVDVDIFILFPLDTPVDTLERMGVEAAEKAAMLLGCQSVRRYASHPYLTLLVDGYMFDVVPAYKVSSPAEMRTAVDRTPFHTRYIKRKLAESPGLAGEVRLLKRFAKGIGVYGAEIKVEGFSGYLVELLAVHYGSFMKCLSMAATEWRPFKTVIDPEGHYAEAREALKRFREPLVVVDPVDRNRNVASPVSLQSMCTFIAAARHFLRRPGINFFYPPKQAVDIDALRAALSGRGIVAVKTVIPPISEDVLWGQLKRVARALAEGLERHGFRVYGTTAWASAGEAILLLELEEPVLSELVKHYGPPVYSGHDMAFLNKYMRGGSVSGPFIENDRWVVIKRRKVRDVRTAVLSLVQGHGMGGQVAEAMRTRCEIFVGDEVVGASSDKSYLEYLADWVRRIPPWMRESSSGGLAGPS